MVNTGRRGLPASIDFCSFLLLHSPCACPKGEDLLGHSLLHEFIQLQCQDTVGIRGRCRLRLLVLFVYFVLKSDLYNPYDIFSVDVSDVKQLYTNGNRVSHKAGCTG